MIALAYVIGAVIGTLAWFYVIKPLLLRVDARLAKWFKVDA